MVVLDVHYLRHDVAQFICCKAIEGYYYKPRVVVPFLALCIQYAVTIYTCRYGCL